MDVCESPNFSYFLGVFGKKALLGSVGLSLGITQRCIPKKRAP